MTVSSVPAAEHQELRTLSDVREYLRGTKQPVFYLSRTTTNLLGVEHWVPGLSFITLADSWEGKHPRVFTPTNVPKIEPRGNINIINWLLRNEQVQRHISEETPAGFTPQIVAAFFDETTEALCRSLGYTLAMPTTALRTRLDSKIVTTQIGNQAGVFSVPNILTRVRDWQDFTQQAEAAGLGSDLVVQTPFGDSGQTTYFISSESDFDRVAKEITSDEVKVMKRINPLSLAAEAIITESGVILGPCLREITGYRELTRYKGGWSGSEMAPSVVPPQTRKRVFELTKTFSEQVAAEGYRGILEVSILVDVDTDEVYLGELNPRISGSSSHSNLVPDPDRGLPLFAFHILEYSGAQLNLNVDEINAALEEGRGNSVWSTMIIQHTLPRTERVTAAPKTGRYSVEPNGSLTFVSAELDWHSLDDSGDVFFLRVLGEGEYRSYGSDLGVLFVRDRLQKEHNELRAEALALIRGVQALYTARPISQARRVARAVARRVKMLFTRS